MSKLSLKKLSKLRDKNNNTLSRLSESNELLQM